MNCVCIMESSPWQDIVNGCVCEQWIRVLVSSEFVDGYVFHLHSWTYVCGYDVHVLHSHVVHGVMLAWCRQCWTMLLRNCLR